MRLAFVISSLLIGSSAFANCLGEAQIISKVTAIKKTMLTCQVQVTAESVSFYQMSQLCPLPLEEVITNGVEVGLENGHECRVNLGDTLTGILVLKPTGTIEIEQSSLKNIIFCSLFFLTGNVGLASANQCEIILNANSLKAVREEIRAANFHDRESGRHGAKISNEIEYRAKDIASLGFANSHVISLGSGADIYLPLYLYPQAKYFHLVDLLTGWGDGPQHVIEEVEARIRSLSPQAQVERIDRLGDWRLLKDNLQGPLIWRARWDSEAAGPQEKLFFLHQMDFRDDQKLNELTSVLYSPNYSGRLGGIVITGISANLETRKKLLSLLSSDGSMFTEMLYTNEAGETSSPNDESILSDLERAYEATNYGRLNGGFRFAPNQFLIKPKQ